MLLKLHVKNHHHVGSISCGVLQFNMWIDCIALFVVWWYTVSAILSETSSRSKMLRHKKFTHFLQRVENDGIIVRTMRILWWHIRYLMQKKVVAVTATLKIPFIIINCRRMTMQIDISHLIQLIRLRLPLLICLLQVRFTISSLHKTSYTTIIYPMV